MKKDIYKSSRILTIGEAALEYFISLMVSGTFLAKISTSLGISDALTGILSSFVSLGYGFQFLALFLFRKKNSVKRTVTVLHLVNQLLFSTVYLLPSAAIGKEVKTAAFVILLLGGYFIANIINSPKVAWHMSLVDDRRRGSYTAQKEIVSLIGGMIFSYGMSAVVDYYEAQDNLPAAFTAGAVALFVLTALHTLTLVFTKEKTEEADAHSQAPSSTPWQTVKKLFADRRVVSVILLTTLWRCADGATGPFYGTYQINDLAFSMTFIAILGIITAIVRAAFSPLFGKIADRRSFRFMLNICYTVAGAAFLVNVFTVPENGKVLFTAYYILSAISMAGINSGSINLMYEVVPHEDRVAALAIQQSIAGVAGFLVTTVVSRLVDYIQKSGNSFLGISMHAQQLTSAVGAVLVVGVLVCLNTSIKPSKPQSAS